MGRPHGAGWGGAPVSRACTPEPSASSGLPAPVGGGGRAWVSPESPAGTPSPSASSFLLLPEARRAPPPCSRAPSLLFPSPGRRRRRLLLPFSPDLSLPARNPFRPGSRSGLAAVCPTPWPSSGLPSGASVCWCARLPAGPGELPPRPSAAPHSRPAWGIPRPGTTLASDRLAAEAPVRPSNPHIPRQSPDLGALGGRTGICPARPFVVMLKGEGAGRGGGRGGPVRAGTSFDSSSSYEPPEISEPGRSPQAGFRPNLKSEPVGATSSRGSSAWSPRPGRGGGKGSGRVGLGAPGPEHPAWHQHLSVLEWLWVGPGATGLEGTGPDCACSLLPAAPSLLPGPPGSLPAQKLAKVLGFHHQAGSICLPGLVLGAGLSLNRATTCAAVCSQTIACPL